MLFWRGGGQPGYLSRIAEYGTALEAADRLYLREQPVRNGYVAGAGDEFARQGLYYYFYTFAHALDAYDEPIITDASGKAHDWRLELIDKLASLQKDDGSWVGDGSVWIASDRADGEPHAFPCPGDHMRALPLPASPVPPARAPAHVGPRRSTPKPARAGSGRHADKRRPA